MDARTGRTDPARPDHCPSWAPTARGWAAGSPGPFAGPGAPGDRGRPERPSPGPGPWAATIPVRITAETAGCADRERRRGALPGTSTRRRSRILAPGATLPMAPAPPGPRLGERSRSTCHMKTEREIAFHLAAVRRCCKPLPAGRSVGGGDEAAAAALHGCGQSGGTPGPGHQRFIAGNTPGTRPGARAGPGHHRHCPVPAQDDPLP